MTEKDFFLRTTKQEIPRTNDRFSHYFENNFMENIKNVLEKIIGSHGIYKIKRVRTLKYRSKVLLEHEHKK